MSVYSERWRAVFGHVDPARTAADVRFIRSVLPLPTHRRVLDVPCGNGRHLRALEALGYEVVGVDNDPAVAPPVLGDLRRLDELPANFDGVLNLWQSFGYFDAAENERVLASFARRLRPGGRLVLELQNRAFFEPRSPTERTLRSGVVERASFERGRRRCELIYPDGAVEIFEFQLYTASELEELGRRHSLRPLVRHASSAAPSMRLVLQRDS